MSDDIKPMFSGEVQLAAWSESHNGGCKITLWLADSSDLDAFRAMTVRKGNTAGQRLACVMVEIADDETAVQEPAPEPKPEPPKGGALARLAGQWCGSQEFWLFLRANGMKCESADDAANIIRSTCKITSRAELDNNADAARIFQDRFRLPYMKWMQRAAG